MFLSAEMTGVPIFGSKGQWSGGRPHNMLALSRHRSSYCYHYSCKLLRTSRVTIQGTFVCDRSLSALSSTRRSICRNSSESGY